MYALKRLLFVLLVLNVHLAYAGLTTGEVDFDAATLHGLSNVTVTLSDKTVLGITRTELIDYDVGVYVWKGTVDGEPESSATFSVNGDVVVGMIQTLQNWWWLELSESAPNEVTEVDPADFEVSDEDPADAIPFFTQSFEDSEKTAPQAVGRGADPVCVDEPSNIDILMLYTPEAAGAVPNINATIQLAIDLANESFARSAIEVGSPLTTLRLNLKHTMEYPFLDFAGYDQRYAVNDLSKLTEVQEERDKRQADVVFLIVKNFGSGAAFKLNKQVPGRPVDEHAYGIINVSRIGGLILAHEVGHIFGADHDRFWTNLAEEPRPENGNFGFINLDSGSVPWRTVMSYNAQCLVQMPPVTCLRTPVFSSPDLVFDGIAPGTIDDHNRAWMILSAPTVACHRQNPKIADISFDNPALDTCVTDKAALESWEYALDVTSLTCNDEGIDDLTGMEYLRNLTHAGLWDNAITDVSPLANLTELVFLDLNGNDITNIDPLADLDKLTWLTLFQNPVSDISVVAGFPILEVLNLSNTNVSDISAVASLTSLLALDIGFLGLDNSDAINLQNLTNLVRLFMAGNNVSDITPLQNLLNIKDLWIYTNDNIADLSPLAGMTELRHFDVGVNAVVDISVLQNKVKLQQLWLPRNNISDLTPLTGLVQLDNLQVHQNEITDATPLHVLTQLEDLNISGQAWPPGLNCTQQQDLLAALPTTTVVVDGFWDDPNDKPDQGNIDCFP